MRKGLYTPSRTADRPAGRATGLSVRRFVGRAGSYYFKGVSANEISRASEQPRALGMVVSF